MSGTQQNGADGEPL